ncbi:hypothetical protein SBFV3_gp24 [Sulfolobales Beppu filamentous virus 3]|uniref:Uncharacterized protein n=1 Tax=Sulfolobales Beppu filamentous virus 3 TaxID=2493124 RepID=A0A3S8NEY2_9VIRU|nr:hypothetical protein HOU83_gp24 [Sulfolobales Beppu filamentous virus 3]AZI75859.1 hypothetical protein SBFV3_gp24 [Sulfolobales Beppu filamentous virus 3]
MALHYYNIRGERMTVDWDEVVDAIKEKLTKKQKELLRKAIDDYGDPEDFIIDVVRKAIDPDLLTVSDIEMCITKAMKVGAYVNAMGGGNGNNVNSIVSEVVNEAYASDNQQQGNNPFVEPLKEIANAIRQQISYEVMNKIQQALGNMPGSNTATVKGNNTVSTTPVNDKVFTGDE